MAGVEQALGTVHTEQQRADPSRPAALAGLPACDDGGGTSYVLDLEPAVAAPSWEVGRVAALGDEALQPLGAGRLEELAAVAVERLGHLPVVTAELQPLESGPPFVVAVAEERPAVQVQH